MSSFFNLVKRVLDRRRASRMTISPSAIVDEALLALDPHRSSADTQREAMAAGILATANSILGPEWTQDSNEIFESRESPEDAVARLKAQAQSATARAKAIEKTLGRAARGALEG
jgi:hypothetical protein